MTKIVVTGKYKKDLDKKIQDVNHRLENYHAQANIDYIKNNIKIETEGFKLESAKPVQLLRITIDQKLTFDTYV